METTTKALRIVIPGGTGLIGRMLTRHLSGLGHHVTVLTRSAGRARAMGNPPGLEKNGLFGGLCLGTRKALATGRVP